MVGVVVFVVPRSAFLEGRRVRRFSDEARVAGVSESFCTCLLRKFNVARWVSNSRLLSSMALTY